MMPSGFDLRPYNEDLLRGKLPWLVGTVFVMRVQLLNACSVTGRNPM